MGGGVPELDAAREKAKRSKENRSLPPSSRDSGGPLHISREVRTESKYLMLRAPTSELVNKNSVHIRTTKFINH